ncbi:MAG: hypothetical protein PVH61_26495 [Candidatus Aminicenantes bacterium]
MKKFKSITAVGMLLLLVLPVSLMPEAVVKLPGSITHFVSYMQSFSATEKDIIYHLCETLLFEQIPAFEEILKVALPKDHPFRYTYEDYKRARWMYNNIQQMTLRNRIKTVITQHRVLKEYLFKKIARDPKEKISLDLKQPQEFAVAKVVLKQIGMGLKKHANHQYRLFESFLPPHNEINHYYQILALNTWGLERVLNKTHRFDFQLKEFEASIPWTFDFLREITGLELNPGSLAEILTRDKRFQLLVALLYRLSDREIDYINRLKPNLNAWKKIYNDDQLLCGMFVLSHALRVKNGQLVLPGAPHPKADPFWNQLVGSDYLRDPFEFLAQLAIKDGGKLNYFYIFTFFLPEDTQRVVWCNFNDQKFREIYHRVELEKKEQIRGLDIPGLRDFGFFTLVYALKTRDGKIEFPGGIDAWAEAMGKKQAKETGSGNKSSGFELLKYLLRTSKKKDSLKRFIPIYCKFFHRPEILTREVIRTLYNNYLEYNVLVDFIERIPIKNPQTVLKLFARVKSFKKLPLGKKGKETVVAVFQSLLELLAQKAKYAPADYQYDRLIGELLQMPLSEASLYDNIFRFLARHLDIDLTPSEVDRSFWDFLLPADPEVVVHHQTYQLEASLILKKQVLEIFEKQCTVNLSLLVKINRLLEYFASSSSSQNYQEAGKQLFEAFRQLPLPEEIDEQRIKKIRRSVNPFSRRNVTSYVESLPETYSTARLFKNLNRLLARKSKQAPQPRIDALVQKIKQDCLLQELKNFLLTAIYAVSIKNARLPVFLNPNLTWHHDFSPYRGKNAWNNSAISQRRRVVAGYHLEGGLSRLSITLAFPYSEYIFGKSIGYEPIQGVPIIANILDMFPYPLMNQGQEYTALLVKFSEELVEKSRENPALRENLKDELMKMTAGYQYRTIIEQLGNHDPEGKSSDSLLYFSQHLRLGEHLFKEGMALAEFSQKQQLEAYREPVLYQAVQEEMNQLGSIYYYTFGTLKPYRYLLFPPPLYNLFASRWASAELINELKVKAAYLSYLKQMPAQLLGCITYRYFLMVADLFFHGSRISHQRTYYLHSVFNYLYLNQIYNTMRKLGILRLK